MGEEKIPGKCNFDKWNDDGYCESDPIDGSDRCRKHAGMDTVRNSTHGVYTNRQNYYRQCTDEQKAWIDAVVSSFLDDAPFGPENFGKFQKLRNIAIDMHKIRSANDYIKDEGIKKENVVGYDDDGSPILQEEEHELNVAIDRLESSTTRNLKELGILDDPDSKKAESEMSLAKALSEQNDVS